MSGVDYEVVAWGQLPSRVRLEVLERDDYTCQYCGKRPKYLYKPAGWDGRTATLHVDHMIPVSRGGSHEIQNLVTACAECNLEKHANLWPAPLAYCWQCNEVTRRPVDAGVWLGIDRPHFRCQECILDDHFPDDQWEEAGAFSDLELEQQAWDAIEQAAWAEAA